jgi:hypothetical protein
MPQPLYPWGNTPSTHWIRGWVGLRAGLDTVTKRFGKTFEIMENCCFITFITGLNKSNPGKDTDCEILKRRQLSTYL